MPEGITLEKTAYCCLVLDYDSHGKSQFSIMWWLMGNIFGRVLRHLPPESRYRFVVEMPLILYLRAVLKQEFNACWAKIHQDLKAQLHIGVSFFLPTPPYHHARVANYNSMDFISIASFLTLSVFHPIGLIHIVWAHI